MGAMAKEKIIGFFVILVFLGYFLSQGITYPYVGYNAWNFNTYSHIAKNYNSFGLAQTKFAPIVSVTKTIPSNPEYYLHHPPLLYIIMSFFYEVLGSGNFVGRLPVILATIGSAVCIYYLGSLMKGKLFGLIAMSIFALIPGTSIFGRMIGHEALLLFFVLLSLVLLLKYLKTNRTIFLFFLVISVLLGTLSDWPMTYFTVAIAPFLIHKKRYMLSGLLVATAALTAFLFLLYIFFLTGNLSDLQQAFFNRSTGELLSYSYWPLRWLGTILLRIILYLNPLIVAMSMWYIVRLFQSYRKKIITGDQILIVCLLIFGLMHVLLYPEGSFGHAYWIYYCIPFVTLSSASYVSKMISRKKNVLLIIALAFSLLFLWKINDWKVKEVKANVFRYTLAEKVSQYIKPYEAIVINNNGVIDSDLLAYKFMYDVTVGNVADLSAGTYPNKTLVYSCSSACNLEDRKLRKLLTDYKNTSVQIPEAQAYIIFLGQKQEKPSSIGFQETNYEKTVPKPVMEKENMLKILYRQIKDFLHAPQI